ncbi:hypothetical protein B0T13DRAFT_446914 [Neurospora crassa]|nr:hypothetical protein B0T13DRAFT_446914 [Neurospora crassa]
MSGINGFKDSKMPSSWRRSTSLLISLKIRDPSGEHQPGGAFYEDMSVFVLHHLPIVTRGTGNGNAMEMQWKQGNHLLVALRMPCRHSSFVILAQQQSLVWLRAVELVVGPGSESNEAMLAHRNLTTKKQVPDASDSAIAHHRNTCMCSNLKGHVQLRPDVGLLLLFEILTAKTFIALSEPLLVRSLTSK